MILASGHFDLTGLLLFAIIGLISWLSNKFSSAGKDGPSEKGQPPVPSARQPGPSNAEDERMRRFLEALGIPADAPEPRREVPPQRSRPAPVPPIVRQPPTVSPQPRKREVPAPPPIPRRRRSLDEEPAPTTVSSRITAGELTVPSVADFETVSSSISAVPTERRQSSSEARAGASLADLVRREMSSPEQLRTAFLVREILGPPRGLQS